MRQKILDRIKRSNQKQRELQALGYHTERSGNGTSYIIHSAGHITEDNKVCTVDIRAICLQEEKTGQETDLLTQIPELKAHFEKTQKPRSNFRK